MNDRCMNNPATEQSRNGASQTAKALSAIRELILTGELLPGSRITELSIVARLRISRTPIRTALVRLEEEGYLEALANGGFAVRSFSEQDIYDAIELRGVLEGLAVRLAAERGVAFASLAAMKSCLQEIDSLLRKPDFEMQDVREFFTLNEQFHDLLIYAANSALLSREVRRMVRLPLTSAGGLIAVNADPKETRRLLTIGQDHHTCVLQAIEDREGSRAEAIMREHARLPRRNLQKIFDDGQLRHLIRRPSPQYDRQDRAPAKDTGIARKESTAVAVALPLRSR